ncbi:MAG: hypothetical protein RL038_993 [Actinomycetota bacterium]
MTSSDITIIGAGPAGLYASYYAGFRGFKVTLIDALSEIGGQVTAMYPEKEIFDIAGLPAIKGRELISQLWGQASQFPIDLNLSEKAVGLKQTASGWQITCESGFEVVSKAVVITGGIGSFTPRPLPTGMEWLGRGLVHFVTSLEAHRGKDVVIVGGGDSAFDWAYSLIPIANSVTLVHRRAEFRAHETTVEKVRQLGARLITNAEINDLKGSDAVEYVEVKTESGTETIPTQLVIAALGFVANIGELANWGLELEMRHIKVNTRMETNFPGVFAAGDLATFEGKVPLISVGFGEAALAVNNAAPYIRSGISVFPGHSSGESH